MEKNSRFTKLYEEIEQEQAEAAVRNQQELESALHNFKKLEKNELSAI